MLDYPLQNVKKDVSLYKIKIPNTVDEDPENLVLGKARRLVKVKDVKSHLENHVHFAVEKRIARVDVNKNVIFL